MSRTKIDPAQLLADADELRKTQMVDHATAESYDYRQMQMLLTITMQRINAIVGDPNGVAVGGVHNDKMLNTLNGLLKTAGSLVKDLNRMRNADRLTKHILASHTASYAESLVSQISPELKAMDAALTSLEQHATNDSIERHAIAREAASLRERLRTFARERLITALGTAGEAALAQAKSQYNLQ